MESQSTGIVPSDWRTAHVSPVYKKDQKYNPENYRPISLRGWSEVKQPEVT
jgi:hypothetical protein